MNVLFWGVDRHGWRWMPKKPSAKALAEVWRSGKATDVANHAPGRREIKA
jgi:hypothetical protein